MYFVTGTTGMVGTYLLSQLKSAGIEAHCPGRVAFDISQPERIASYLAQYKFSVFIHVAAETNVDLCETDPVHAYTLNALSTQAIARYCAEHDKKMLYVSTSNVFGGHLQHSYNELDIPLPVNYYGKSKLKGEEFLKAEMKKYFIVRSGWMIGGGPNIDKKFVGKMLRSLESGTKSVSAVADKQGSLTYAKHLAEFILQLVATEDYGTYHYSSATPCSRYDIAKELVRRFGKDVELKPCASTMFPLAAPRPVSEAMTTVVRGASDRTRYTWEQLIDIYLREWSEI